MSGRPLAAGLEKSAAIAALSAMGVLSALALLAGAVRVLPLLSDPALPWQAAEPFARSLVWLALEVALFVGWSLGWGVASAAAVDRGEARVYALLGRSPREVLGIFVPQAVLFTLVLGGASWLAARDAREPGRVLAAIVESGRVECASVSEPRATTVPFLDAQWLCAPGVAPRFFLRPPRPASGAAITAAAVRLSPDVRDVWLDDVHIAMGRGSLTAREVSLRRLPPLVASASLRPTARAAAVVAGALCTSFGLAWLILFLGIRRRIVAVALGGAAASAAFGVLRAIDRAGADPGAPGVEGALLALVPVAGVGALALGAAFLLCLRRLKAAGATATP